VTTAFSRRSVDLADLGVAAFAFVAIVVHDAAHLAAGRYWDVFWVCNVSAALVGPAILFRSPLLSAAALTWIVPGTGVWLADAFVAHSNILPTSYAVHIGGTLAACYATRVSGFARRGWLFALAVLALSVLVSRLFLPAFANVNAAHSIPKGWGFLGQRRAAFVVAATALSLACCLLGRALGKAIGGHREGSSASLRRH
jgi:hypothetical protein